MYRRRRNVYTEGEERARRIQGIMLPTFHRKSALARAGGGGGCRLWFVHPSESKQK